MERYQIRPDLVEDVHRNGRKRQGCNAIASRLKTCTQDLGYRRDGGLPCYYLG
jgi:hypothetical protein